MGDLCEGDERIYTAAKKDPRSFARRDPAMSVVTHTLARGPDTGPRARWRRDLFVHAGRDSRLDSLVC